MSAPASSSSSSSSSPLEEWLSRYIPKTHASVGLSNVSAHEKEIRILLTHRKLPELGWSDFQIQNLLHQLAILDTNHKGSSNNDNDTRWCGVGEREGRVYSDMVQQRHYYLAHGMGRSGDLREPQPKAAGSSLIVQLTTSLVLDVMKRVCKLRQIASYGLVTPLCTGMTIALVLSALIVQRNNQNDDNSSRRRRRRRNIVLWSRIDQKSCYKAILAANCECIVVPTKLLGDAVVTDLDALRQLLIEYHMQQKDEEVNIIAIITTTSCFAPRLPDRVDSVAQLCAEYDIPHIINHAYGLQCKTTCTLLERANTIGRVDAVICSTDKNFLVPVGGAIVVSSHAQMINQIGHVYAGRASISPILDLFMTLLNMGISGYRKLLDDRIRLVQDYFIPTFRAVAEKYGERLLVVDDNDEKNDGNGKCTNTISFAMTLDGLAHRPRMNDEDDVTYCHAIERDMTQLGAMLFTRCVSGTRVVPRGVIKIMDNNGGIETFVGFGSSYHAYPHAYLTAAAAIGLTKVEATEFFHRLDKTLNECVKKKNKKIQQQQEPPPQPQPTEQPDPEQQQQQS
jgi:O-phospho-L-seryl-tRNASec:L-selenocysteinyl-tRNA synthase